MPHQHLTIAQIKALLQQAADETALQPFTADPRAGVAQLLASTRRRISRAADEQQRLHTLQHYERLLWDSGTRHIAGVDEAGAGPLAGPVMAAAVILPAGLALPGLDDSKKLSAKQREQLETQIKAVAIAWALGHCTPQEIDSINILQASRRAMARAVQALRVAPEQLLVDARTVPDVSMPQQALINGDARSHSIAAASILAKVERDRLMETLAREHPGYGFEQHRGYGTAQHLEALQRLGPSPIHRLSFAPVRSAMRDSR